jgi:hypothetical protein
MKMESVKAVMSDSAGAEGKHLLTVPLDSMDIAMVIVTEPETK